MAIQVRRGNEVDFDGSKMKSGEFATTVDSKKVYHAFSAGDVTELATRAEMETMIGDITDDIITETTTAINTAIDNAETATTNAQTEITNMQTLEGNVEDAEALRVTAEIARQDAITGETYRITNETEREEWYDATKVMETYNPAKLYIPENKVTYGGETWRNLVSCTGVTPVEGTNWTIFAKKGIDGTGGNMNTTVYDTTGKAEDIFLYSDNADTLSNLETVGVGVLYNSGLVTSAQSTPNMTVAISTGTAFLPSGARVTPTAVVSQTITTSDATNPRKDITYVNSSGVISYLAGTASATPTAPSLPSGGVLLAEIYVGTGVTTITNANITDRRSIIKSNADLVDVSNDMYIELSDKATQQSLELTDSNVSSLYGKIVTVSTNSLSSWVRGGISGSTGAEDNTSGTKLIAVRTGLLQINTGTTVSNMNVSGYRLVCHGYSLVDNSWISVLFDTELDSVVTHTINIDCYIRIVMLKLSYATIVDSEIANIISYCKLVLNTNGTLPMIPFGKWGGKKLLVTGDSIPYGIYDSELQNVVADNFCAIVARNHGMTLTNYSISASTIAVKQSDPTTYTPISSRFSSMSNDGDLIVVFAGTNDFVHNWTDIGAVSDMTTYTFYGALNVLCTGLLNKYPKKQILFFTPLKRIWGTYTTIDSVNSKGKTLKQYGEIIKEVCDRYSIPVFDLYSMSGINPQISEQATALIPDLTHPNQDGHYLIASKLTAYLNQL